MFHCTIFHGDTELATRLFPALPPMGTELCIDGHLDTVYYVAGCRIFLEEFALDIRTEVYVYPLPNLATGEEACATDPDTQRQLEELAAQPWRPQPPSAPALDSLFHVITETADLAEQIRHDLGHRTQE